MEFLQNIIMTGSVTGSGTSRVYSDNLGSLDVIRISWLGTICRVSRRVELDVVPR